MKLAPIFVKSAVSGRSFVPEKACCASIQTATRPSHYIRKPADASLLGMRLKVLRFIHDTNQKKNGKWTSPATSWINLHDGDKI
jgi:hypothetical protein